MVNADQRMTVAVMSRVYERDDDADPLLVWDLWLAILADEPDAGYDRFKRTVRQLVYEGRLATTPPDGKKKTHLARQHVSVTDDGVTWWSETVTYGEALGVSLDTRGEALALVGKRITGTHAVPREVWRELMRRQRAGELDVVFVTRKTATRKTATGGS